MTAPVSSINSPTTRYQSGATLLIAIVFLLVITVLAISSMRGVSLESRITANLKQKKTLTSAAEAGLRIGENSISRIRRPDTAPHCGDDSLACMPWELTDITADDNKDTPARFAAGNDASVARVITGYDTTTQKIQWYVVVLGKMGIQSQNDCAVRGCGVWYYEVNACASTEWCTASTDAPRVTLRTVIARYYP